MKLIGLWNSKGIEGTSGGDVVFQELWKRFECEKILIEPKNKKQPACFTAEYIKRILDNVKLPEGDIVYASSDFPPDVIPAYYSGKPWIQKIYHVIPRRSVSQIAQRFCFELIKQKCDLIIVCSFLLRNQLIDMGFTNRIEVIYPGVYAQKPANYIPKKYDAVFVGRLHKSKGISDLSKIWEEVVKIKPTAKLAVIGSGDMKAQENVDILGYVSETEKEQVLRSSRMFISTSHEEGFGLAIAEAMAYGLPAVGWDLPIYKEIFMGNMLVAPMGDIDEFVKNVEFYMIFEDYPGGTKLMEYVTRYRWDKSAKQEMDLICELLKK